MDVWELAPIKKFQGPLELWKTPFLEQEIRVAITIDLCAQMEN